MIPNTFFLWQFFVTVLIDYSKTCSYILISENDNIDDWNIESCCSSARNVNCKQACVLFNRTININESCRRSDEPEFFSCLVNRRNAHNCCALISNETCKSICKELFNEPGNTSIAKYYKNKANCFNHLPKCLKSVMGIEKIEEPSQCKLNSWKVVNKIQFFAFSTSCFINFPTKKRVFARLISYLDSLMFVSKNKKKNNFLFTSPQMHIVAIRLQMLNALKRVGESFARRILRKRFWML